MRYFTLASLTAAALALGFLATAPAMAQSPQPAPAAKSDKMAPAPKAAPAATSDKMAPAPKAELLDINSATAEQLEALRPPAPGHPPVDLEQGAILLADARQM